MVHVQAQLGYAVICTMRMVFFSKRQKNSSLCVELKPNKIHIKNDSKAKATPNV